MTNNFKVRYVNRGFTTAQRIWTNALGLKFDPWHSCTNWCLYCYARYLEKMTFDRQHRIFDPNSMRIEKIDKIKNQLEKVFDKGQVDGTNFVEYALSKRMPVECGTMGEPFQENDLAFRITYNFLLLLKHYDYPLYINTKANLLVKNHEYFNLLTSLKHLVVDLSLAGLHDEALRKWEPKCPSATERFELVKRLLEKGVNVIISARPIVPNATEVDYEEYITKLCEAGVKAIHLRPFFIMPNMRTTNPAFFDKVIKEDKFNWVKKMFQWRNNETFIDLIKRGLPICEKYGVALTGAHRYFFRLQGHWNKCDYRMMPNFYPYLFPYTIPHLLEKVFKNREKEQILKFKEIIPNVENRIFKIIPAISPFFHSTCDDLTLRGKGYLTFETILKEALWGTWKGGLKSYYLHKGQISTLCDIHLLTKNGEPLRDEEGNVIYKYTPAKNRYDFDNQNNKPILTD